MKKIDKMAAPMRNGTFYPPPYDKPCLERVRWRLGDAAGLTRFGINYLKLKPGVWSSQRHWHAKADEFIYVLEGEVALITDAGEETLATGDCAGFKGGDHDGHHLINRSDADAIVLEIGSRLPDDSGEYSDIDMKFEGAGYTHKDGTPF